MEIEEEGGGTIFTTAKRGSSQTKSVPDFFALKVGNEDVREYIWMGGKARLRSRLTHKP